MAGAPGLHAVADPVLAAMRAQYENQAAFGAGVVAQLQAPAGLFPPPGYAGGAPLHPGLDINSVLRATPGPPPLHPPPLLGAAGLVPSDAIARSAAHAASSERQNEAQATARVQKTKEEIARKEAQDQEEQMRRRCHLHKRPKNGCKFCQRHTDFVNECKEDKAALREKFINDVRKARDDSQRSDPWNKSGLIEIANNKTFGFPPLLQNHVVESTHFKTLMTLDTIEQVYDEITNFAESVEPYLQNRETVPTAMFCSVYRLFTMGIDGQQLRRTIEHEGGPYIRCAGFLFIRFGLAPEQLWPWLGEYVLDDEELKPSKDAEWVTTIGEYVESLLVQDQYFSTVLPRLPASTKRKLQEKLAMAPSFRKRSKANQDLLDVYRKRGVRVEVCLEDGDWVPAESVELIETSPSRLQLRVRLQSGIQETVHLGKVIITDPRHTSSGSSRPRRQRSRSRSPDWSREKGKSSAELLDEMRRREQDRAVCTSGKEYSKRPVSFKVALPMEQGNASHRLIQDETYVAATKRSGDRRDRSRSREQRKEPSAEHQARMRAVFEKYGMSKGSDEAQRRSDIEGPDKLRLG